MPKQMPVKRGERPRPSNSRRAAPAQQRRTAAAAPPRRRTQDEDPEEETTAFDGAGAADSSEDEEDLPDVVDLSGVEAASYKLIPKGWYEGYIEEVEYGRSQSKNLPQLVFKVNFMVEEEDKETGEMVEKERSLRYYAGLSGDSAGYTKALLAKLDPELDMATFKPGDADEHFSDMDVRVRVSHRNDREDRRIKRANIADMEPLADDEDFEDE